MQPHKFCGAQRRCNSWGSSTSSVTICSTTDNGSLTNLDCCAVNVNDDGAGSLDFFGPQTRNSLGLGQHQRRQSQVVATMSSTVLMDTILSERSPPPPPTAPRVPVRPKQRSCSCSSQTDLSIGSIENLATALAASPTPSLPNLQSLPLGRLERFFVFEFSGFISLDSLVPFSYMSLFPLSRYTFQNHKI